MCIDAQTEHGFHLLPNFRYIQMHCLAPITRQCKQDNHSGILPFQGGHVAWGLFSTVVAKRSPEGYVRLFCGHALCTSQ